MRIFSWICCLLICSSSAIPEKEVRVFSTDQFSASDDIRINGKDLVIKSRVSCNTNVGPPLHCNSVLYFSSLYPELKLHGTAYQFAASDLNKDGYDEILILTREGGNWSSVNVFAFNPVNKQWYSPFESFLWYPGFEGEEGCGAQIFWLPESGRVKIKTTNAAVIGFDCSEVKVLAWKKQS